MAKIVYSMSGDGRGHATRVQTIVDRLKSDHEFLLLCAQDAYDLLTGIYHFDDRVTVEKIPGMSFGYSGNKVSYTKCFVKNGSYIWNVGQHVERVEKRISNFGGEFAITDFEPSLPRAAHNLGIPYLSFDHQHTLSVSDFSALPLRLRWKAYFIAKVIPLYFTTQCRTIVSSFHHFPSLPNLQSTNRVGVLIREKLFEIPVMHEPYLLCYLRRFGDQKILDVLRSCPMNVKVYGLGERENSGNLEFLPVSTDQFSDDLANCHAVICNAGNQLLGESLYLRKPVLAIPELGNYEQMLNGYLLNQLKGGTSVLTHQFDSECLDQFVRQADRVREEIDATSIVGNNQSERLIRQEIELHCPAEAARATEAARTTVPKTDSIPAA